MRGWRPLCALALGVLALGCGGTLKPGVCVYNGFDTPLTVEIEGTRQTLAPKTSAKVTASDTEEQTVTFTLRGIRDPVESRDVVPTRTCEGWINPLQRAHVVQSAWIYGGTQPAPADVPLGNPAWFSDTTDLGWEDPPEVLYSGVDGETRSFLSDRESFGWGFDAAMWELWRLDPEGAAAMAQARMLAVPGDENARDMVWMELGPERALEIATQIRDARDDLAGDMLYQDLAADYEADRIARTELLLANPDDLDNRVLLARVETNSAVRSEILGPVLLADPGHPEANRLMALEAFESADYALADVYYTRARLTGGQPDQQHWHYMTLLLTGAAWNDDRLVELAGNLDSGQDARVMQACLATMAGEDPRTVEGRLRAQLLDVGMDELYVGSLLSHSYRCGGDMHLALQRLSTQDSWPFLLTVLSDGMGSEYGAREALDRFPIDGTLEPALHAALLEQWNPDQAEAGWAFAEGFDPQRASLRTADLSSADAIEAWMGQLPAGTDYGPLYWAAMVLLEARGEKGSEGWAHARYGATLWLYPHQRPYWGKASPLAL
jgi:hypothetical protein